MSGNTTDKRLFLLDAMALIYRAHFAFIRNPMYNSRGMNTSALFGFTNNLLDLLERENPTHVGIAFDTNQPTFREQEYPEYKANREEQPEDIQIATPVVKRMAQAFRIPVLEKPGYEADDLIGTLAKQAAREGFEVYMVTPDKDYAQLVEPNIYLMKPARSGKPGELWDMDTVKKEFDIDEVSQVVDVQGLTGDSVDNIPGVEGIGPKTAGKLIREFGDIETLIASTDQLKGKQKAKIEEASDIALQSKRLATIDTASPVHFDEAGLKREEPDDEALKGLLQELEFRSIWRKLYGDSDSSEQQQQEQGDLFQQQQKAEPAQPLQPALTTLDQVATDYHLIQSADDRHAVVRELQQCGAFAIDTETSGLNPQVADLVGISISPESGKGYYLPTNDPESCRAVIAALNPVLADPSIIKIGQNIKFDLVILHRFGAEIKGQVFDTMIAHYLLEPELRHNMDYLAEQYLQYKPVPIEQLIGKKGKGQASMEDLAPETIKDYACEDSDITYQLYEVFYPQLKEQGYTELYDTIEGPLICVLEEMEREGVRVDQQQLHSFSRELGEEMQTLQEEIYQMVGERFNINSPKQLGELLFEKLQLDPNAKKSQKSQQYSTNEEVLTRLAAKHSVARKVLDYRSVQKLKSTYVDALPELINERTGRIHTSYQQAVAATGRLSSTNPNLQNIPIRTEKGRRIREAFVPREAGYSLLAADYSQIELRLMAAMSEDPALIQAFRKGEDIHSSTAARIYQVPFDQVTDEMRRNAKTVNFGIIYGISAYGLAQRLNIPRQEASDVIENYFAEYPQVKVYMDSQIAHARRHGHVKTLFGRQRTLRDINSSNSNQRGFAERNAINSPIQGTAADLIKKAMVDIQGDIKKHRLASRMTLQVHDELIFDAHNDELDVLKPLITDKMQNVLDLAVPLEVEIGVGANWLQAH